MAEGWGTRKRRFANITTQSTSSLVPGPGMLHGIVINKPVVGGNFIIYDSTVGSGTVIGTVTFSASTIDTPQSLDYFGGTFNNGLTIVCSTDFDLTVVWS